MHRPVLALDLGAKRIGAALNPTGSVILELPTIIRQADGDLLPRIEALVETHGIQEIIVGQAPKLDHEIQALRERLSVPVRILDEVLTTKEAERQMAVEGVRGDSDARAARLILEQYLVDRGDV